MDVALVVILAISGALTVACWIVLWRGPDRIVGKVLWTLIAAAPCVGPVLFAALHDPPSVQPEIDRAQGAWDVTLDMSHSEVPGHHQ